MTARAATGPTEPTGPTGPTEPTEPTGLTGPAGPAGTAETGGSGDLGPGEAVRSMSSGAVVDAGAPAGSWLGRRDPADFPAGLVAEAQATADAAAEAVGVCFVEYRSIAEMNEAAGLLDRVWRPGGGGSPLVTAALLKVLAHCGSYVVGAHRQDRVVGVCLGLLADFGLHSHITGIEDGWRGGGLGRALKLHQRAWCLRRGIGAVTWTYDPLVSRNAYFNLAKLGAVAVQYHPDYYGEMADERNVGIPSDRLLVRWDLAGPHTRAVLSGDFTPATDDAVVALGVGPDGGPVIAGADRVRGAGRLLTAVPRDVEELRVRDPALAARWRPALREVLGGLLADGARITGFTRDGWYVVERPEQSEQMRQTPRTQHIAPGHNQEDHS
ncbi:hypothetical protein GCM10009838_21750 [Catenulispora subtropica]|uniref:N-acetyltransferase domain-containing protein n=2 Tax=Catenulispora subtropica TaxID=450798 RepID=A0ABP5CIE7_9ACTN